MSVAELPGRTPVSRSSVQNKVIYEQPLKERIRVFLRLEFLFQQAQHSLKAGSVWDSRVAVNSLLDILSFFVRTDVKSEVLKELERHASNLERLERTPGVDSTTLAEVLGELDQMQDVLHHMNGQIGSPLRESDLLTSVSKRACVPGGTCSFDLPIYHHWLQRPAELRLQELHQWMDQFQPIRHAIALMLSITRESAVPAKEVAEAGFFQRNLDPSVPWQLLRVGVPAGFPCFAEISAGKHRFTVRFMKPMGSDRPVQTDSDVEFELSCCVI